MPLHYFPPKPHWIVAGTRAALCVQLSCLQLDVAVPRALPFWQVVCFGDLLPAMTPGWDADSAAEGWEQQTFLCHGWDGKDWKQGCCMGFFLRCKKRWAVIEPDSRLSSHHLLAEGWWLFFPKSLCSLVLGQSLIGGNLQSSSQQY